MDRRDFFHGLQFNDERIFDDEVGAETFLAAFLAHAKAQRRKETSSCSPLCALAPLREKFLLQSIHHPLDPILD